MFIAAFGMATMLDPFLVLLVDVMASNYNCSLQSSACAEDYTSGGCDCFTGDFKKLWDRLYADEGSGVTGLFITVMLYVASTVMATLLLHEFLVHVHKDAR